MKRSASEFPFSNISLKRTRSIVVADVPDDETLLRLSMLFRKRISDITAEEIYTVSQYPQHLSNGATNPKWLSARKHRCTGSRVAAIASLSKYGTPETVLEQMLWSSFQGNRATEYGNSHEDDAQATYERYLKNLITSRVVIDSWQLKSYKITNLGLIIDPTSPMFAMSPDGVVELTWTKPDVPDRVERRLLEYKCPFSLRNGLPRIDGNLYASEPVLSCKDLCDDGGFTTECKPIPGMYQCQIQWGMSILNERFLTKPFKTDFVVWCPCPSMTPTSYYKKNGSYSDGDGRVQVTTLDYDRKFTEKLRTIVRQFWDNRYVRAALLRQMNCLLPNDIFPPLSIEE